MNNIFGRFLPTDSLLGKLDPRTKIVIDFFFVIILLFANSWLTYGILIFFVAFAIYCSKIPIKVFWLGLRSILSLVILMMLIQLLLTAPSDQSDILISFGWLRISSTGLINSIIIVLRFFLMIFMTTLLTVTTPSTSIADGISSLLKPLSKIGLDTKTFALLISMTLRFVPILSDEFSTIVDAQRSRGLSLKTGSIVKRTKTLIPMIIPLISVAFKKALTLADTMEIRGFIDAKSRTSFHQLKFQKIDLIVLIIFTVISFSIVYFSYAKL
ncbi:energy-coupling factor transporter transmembrane component T family protein [Oenococcus oeni]|uniref:energy-coupling factor transporter transmembrane component T family protein n=1 Tax=Oenococcus oeni TaxID=1247 RepID=UPI0010B67680|nr:energy-coupling factor transporter transmembrane component T [Oenococcus oeni]SYW10720.1 Energy-coupling factor transporter transmembrane protein EcfT [Oenococcus oeni]